MSLKPYCNQKTNLLSGRQLLADSLEIVHRQYVAHTKQRPSYSGQVELDAREHDSCAGQSDLALPLLIGYNSPILFALVMSNTVVTLCFLVGLVTCIVLAVALAALSIANVATKSPISRSTPVAPLPLLPSSPQTVEETANAGE